jgi:hypothetical protein
MWPSAGERAPGDLHAGRVAGHARHRQACTISVHPDEGMGPIVAYIVVREDRLSDLGRIAFGFVDCFAIARL